jgi:hypothetical protein
VCDVARRRRGIATHDQLRRGVSRERAASEDHRSDKARDPRRGEWRGEACRTLHDVVSRSDICLASPCPVAKPNRAAASLAMR